jgi:hypothetical protein
MAKTITLTVNVDDTQFKAFQKNFADLQQKMQSLTTNWNNISKATGRSTKSVDDYAKSVTNFFSQTVRVVPFFERITANIAKWSAIVGSLTMMLGTGAGLFGIERLTNSLIQRRRQVMGLGGDWGGVQAAQVGTMGTMGDPMSIMQKIRLGSLGDQPIRRGLLAAGVSPQDILNKKPEEIYEEVIRRIPDILGQAPKGQEVPFLRQRGLTRFMPEEDWMKFIKPGGGVNMEEVQRIIKQIEEAKKKGLTPEEGRKWADLYEAAKGFVLDIQTKLGSALSGIAVSLTGLSKSFSDLLAAFLEMPVVKRALEQLRTWLDDFAKYLASDEAKKKLEEWTQELEKVPWAQLASTIGSFISELGTVLRALLAFKGAMLGGAIGARTGAMFGPWGAVIGGVGGAIGGGLLGWKTPEALTWGLRGFGGTPEPAPGTTSTFSERFGDWHTKYPGRGGWTANPFSPWFKDQPADTTPPQGGPQGTPTPQRNQPWPAWMDWFFGKGAVPPPAAQRPDQFSQWYNQQSPTNTAWNQFSPWFNQRSPAFTVNPQIANAAAPPPSVGAASGPTSTSSSYASTGGNIAASLGSRTNMAGGTSDVNLASWNVAARGALPSGVGGGWSAVMAMNNSFSNNAGKGGRRGQGGALDIDNWQLNRTAQLRIDNAAGANVHTTGIAMG